MREYEIDPIALGFDLVPAAALAGGAPEENAGALVAMLEGEAGPLRDVTVLNAGAAIYVAGLTADHAAGIEAARAAVDSGAALAKLVELRDFYAG